MIFLFTLVGAIAAGLAVTLALAVRQQGSAGRALPVTAEWIDELSVDRYRPMLRLLDGSDLEFLRSQPGSNPRILSRLRRQRCQIFHGYLGCLNSDFQRTCTALKLLMLQSRYDRPDLASALLRARMDFARGMLTVRLRLSLYRLGLAGVDVSGLVRLFDGMRLELRTMVPVSSLT
jgi:hypothetical protein